MSACSTCRPSPSTRSPARAPRNGSMVSSPIAFPSGKAGPRSRELLQKLTDADLSNAALPWLTGKFIDVGIAQAHALRVNFVGELGFELHHPIEMQNTIFDLVMEAGRDF